MNVRSTLSTRWKKWDIETPQRRSIHAGAANGIYHVFLLVLNWKPALNAEASGAPFSIVQSILSLLTLKLINVANWWNAGRECQKEDWKSGIPRPHKAICGKAIGNDPESLTNTSPESPSIFSLMIPKPDPNFRRSPALLHQINKLKEHPDVDYTVSLLKIYDYLK